MLASLSVTADIVINQEPIIKQENFVNKALDNSTAIILFTFTFPAFGELGKHKFDLLCGNNIVRGFCNIKFGFKRFFFVFKFLQSCRQRFGLNARLNRVQSVFDCLADIF